MQFHWNKLSWACKFEYITRMVQHFNYKELTEIAIDMFRIQNAFP